MLRDRLGVSERRACRYVGQHRCTQRYESVRAADDAALRVELRKVSAERPRWGTAARIIGCARRAGR
jgi:putative transposase